MAVFNVAHHKTRWNYNKLTCKHAQTKHGKHVSVGSLHKKKQNITGWNKDTLNDYFGRPLDYQRYSGKKKGSAVPSILSFCQSAILLYHFSTCRNSSISGSLQVKQAYPSVILIGTSMLFARNTVYNFYAHCCQFYLWKIESRPVQPCLQLCTMIWDFHLKRYKSIITILNLPKCFMKYYNSIF